jgi:hypothetical protein
LASKFIESVELQRNNPACELMIVCRSPADDDVVFLTEVWSTEPDWEEARSSPSSPSGRRTCRRSCPNLPRAFDSTQSQGKVSRSQGHEYDESLPIRTSQKSAAEIDDSASEGSGLAQWTS